MAQSKTVIIIGGGYAGVLAASRLKKSARELRVILINERDNFVERIRLHEVASGIKSPHRFIRDLLHPGAEFIQARVAKIRSEKQEVVLEDSEGSVLNYDFLLLASGSRMDTELIPGSEENAWFLKDLESANNLFQELRKPERDSVLMVGAGLTGIELAAELAESFPGKKVSLLTSGLLGANYAGAGQAHLIKTMESLGVKLLEERRVKEIQAGKLLTSDDESLPFDLCVVSAGFRANELARKSNLPVNARGQVLISADLQVAGQERIFAAGDCASQESAGAGGAPGADTGAINIRMGCVTAMPMGAHAADNIIRALRRQETQDFKFAYAVNCVSLGRKRGFIQFTNQDDSPRARILQGRSAVWFKELICKFTVFMLRLEAKVFFKTYAWPKPKRIKGNNNESSGRLHQV